MKTFHFQHTFAQKVPHLQEKLTQLEKDILQDQPLKKLADDLVDVEIFLIGWYLRYYKLDTKGGLGERLHTLSVSHKLDRTLLADVAKKLNEAPKPQKPETLEEEAGYSGPNRSSWYYLKRIFGMRQKSEYKLDRDKLHIQGDSDYKIRESYRTCQDLLAGSGVLSIEYAGGACLAAFMYVIIQARLLVWACWILAAWSVVLLIRNVFLYVQVELEWKQALEKIQDSGGYDPLNQTWLHFWWEMALIIAFHLIVVAVAFAIAGAR